MNDERHDEEVRTRKRSSTESLLIANEEPDIKIQIPNNNNNNNDNNQQQKTRRRSSWQFIDVVDSPSFKNSADLRELHFLFPEDQVQWLYRVDNEFAKSAKNIKDAIKENFDETVVDIYQNGMWTKYATFPPLASIQLEYASNAGRKMKTILDGLYEVDLSSRSIKPIYWHSNIQTTVVRATWWKKIPAALGLVSGNSYTPLSERESLAAEAAMLMFYQNTDENFLSSRSDKCIISSTNDYKLLQKLDTMAYTTIALGPLLNHFEIKDELENKILIPEMFDAFKIKILNEQKRSSSLTKNQKQHSVETIGMTTNTAWPIGSQEAINQLQIALKAGASSSKGLLSSIGSIRRGSGSNGGAEKHYPKKTTTISSSSISNDDNNNNNNNNAVSSVKSKRHLVFVIHGIGETFSQFNGDYISTIVDSASDLRKLTKDLVNRNKKRDMENANLELVFLPIIWADVIHEANAPTTKQLNSITLNNIPFIRNLANNLVSDVLFYCDNVQRNRILMKVTNEMNKTYDEYLKRNPEFNGTVSIIGHSLGSVISFDLLSLQRRVVIDDDDTITTSDDDKNAPDSIIDDIETNFDISKLQLNFKNVEHLFCIGSPLGMFLTIRGGNGHGELKRLTKLPTAKHYYNIFHEYDPVAYRIEPLIDMQFSNIDPLDLQRFDKSEPIQKTLKKSVNAVHGAVKFMYNNIANIKLPSMSDLRPSFGGGSSSSSNSSSDKASNTNDGNNNKNNNDNNGDGTQEEVEKDTRTPLEIAMANGFGSLNAGSRLDYQLLSSDVEAVTNYVASARGHSSYWNSSDFVNFVMEKIYDSVLLMESK